MGKAKIVAEKKMTVQEKDPPENVIYSYRPGDDEEEIKKIIRKYMPAARKKKK